MFNETVIQFMNTQKHGRKEDRSDLIEKCCRRKATFFS